eukprot:593923-Alexandrium_andersonii.AAC.1
MSETRSATSLVRDNEPPSIPAVVGRFGTCSNGAAEKLRVPGAIANDRHGRRADWLLHWRTLSFRQVSDCTLGASPCEAPGFGRLPMDNSKCR